MVFCLVGFFYIMKKYLVLLALGLFCATSQAAVPSAEKLLPSDTIFMLSAPDAMKLKAVFDTSPQGQLWQDPAMRPFREDFNKRFSTNFVESFEKELGIKIADYKEMAQGQVTFAVTQNGWNGNSDAKLGIVLLIDSGTKNDLLKKNLEALKKRWLDSGKQIKTEKIQNFEFTTITTTDEELGKSVAKIFPGREQPAGETNKIEITVGQADSLLLVANSPKVIEKILSKLSGGLVPGLAEEAIYETSHNAHFRGAHLFAWANPKPLFDAWKAAPVAEEDGLAPKPDKILSAVGLNGLKSLAFSYTDTPEGGSAKFVIGAPEATRQGLLKMLIPETKDAGPLPYLPADVAKFNRWRINLQKTFNAVETMVTEMSPAAAGVFKLVLDSAGKDQDPNFDLRKELIGNLGDDLIAIQKPARTASLEDVASPPTLYMIGSPNAEKLAHALKVALSSLGQDTFKEREFLGRKVFTLNMPAGAFGSTTVPKALHFSSTASYFASSTDVAILEEFLRSSEFKGKPLSETAGLTEAIQKVGGVSTGLFGYENQKEAARVAFDALKKDPSAADSILGLSAISSEGEEGESKTKQWADFGLLPAFDAVSKYFHFSVYTGTADANGLTFSVFAPTPPQLKK